MFGHKLREQNIITERGEGLAVGCLRSSMPFTTQARHQTGWASGVYTYFYHNRLLFISYADIIVHNNIYLIEQGCTYKAMYGQFKKVSRITLAK